ncbi:hypothetical protein N8D56_12090 [Devosia sp. A8/3-2]|nr:hypothetical protein N8D56_12090 [Devosia sp. A8/3-2]
MDIYNAAVADLMSGGDAAAAQAQIDGARNQIAALCAQTGNSDIDACPATYGLSLPAVPGIQPAAPTEQPTAPAEQPAIDPAQPPAAETLPAEPTEVIETLPEGITQEQIAPVLDSAKDVEATPAVEGQPAVEAQPQPVPETPPAPPRLTTLPLRPPSRSPRKLPCALPFRKKARRLKSGLWNLSRCRRTSRSSIRPT